MRGAFQSVSTYEIRLDSFAALAECKASANTGGPSACRAPRARCETAAQMADRPVDRAALREIDFVHTDAGVPTCALERFESIRGCAERFRGRRFRAVFVGGDYDWGDRFYTVMGARPGVALHAYSAYSMTHPLRAGHGWDFLVDVVVGAVAGVLLLRSWGHFGLYGLAKRCWRVVRSFSILVLAFLVVIVLVPWWFGVWTNPSLTLLGLFAKSWHTSIHQVGLAAHRRPRLRDQIVGLGYGAGWIVVVLWAVSLMLFTEH